jgi:hypothetical protein
MSKLAILALPVALGATAVAQSRVSMGRPAAGPVGMGGRHFGSGISVVETGHRHPFGRSPFFYGYGAPYFYSDDYEPYDLQYARSEPAPQPLPLSQANPEPLPEPVLLELHGGQWVKVTNFGETSQKALNPSSQSASAKPMPAAVLVYRDGHSEEISSYSIIDRVMYTKSDYYSSGSWTRAIQIADLDIPATLKQNQARGVKFDLPSGPDEVVIRP